MAFATSRCVCPSRSIRRMIHRLRRDAYSPGVSSSRSIWRIVAAFRMPHSASSRVLSATVVPEGLRIFWTGETRDFFMPPFLQAKSIFRNPRFAHPPAEGNRSGQAATRNKRLPAGGRMAYASSDAPRKARARKDSP